MAVTGAASTTATDVAALTCSFPAINGRKYRVTIKVTTRNASGAASITSHQVYVADGAGTQVTWSSVDLSASPLYAHHFSARDNLVYAGGTNVPGTLAATITMKVQIARSGGSGNVETFATASLPNQIWVDDVGPV